MPALTATQIAKADRSIVQLEECIAFLRAALKDGNQTDATYWAKKCQSTSYGTFNAVRQQAAAPRS